MKILSTIKKLLGITDEYTVYDTDIIIFINTAINALYQLGVGPSNFTITSTTTWSDYLGNETNVEMVKTYIYIKTKLLFDPGTNSTITKALEEQLKEIESRITYHEESEVL